MDANRRIKICVTQTIVASARRVFAAWVDPAQARKFVLGTPTGDERVQIDARVGGRFSFSREQAGGDAAESGEYFVLDPPRRLVFGHSAPGSSCQVEVVTVHIAALGAGCELALVHELDPGRADQAVEIERRWRQALQLLAAMLETGSFRRLFRRLLGRQSSDAEAAGG